MKKQFKAEKEVKTIEKNNFRYVCPACTNKAFESTNKMVGVNFTCQVCGKEFITVEENYIKL